MARKPQLSASRNAVKAKYKTREYKDARRQLAAVVAAGLAYCKQPECVMPDRWIRPGTPWDTAHNDAGDTVIGAAHRRCNRRDGAVRGNKMRSAPQRFVL